jgi:hypothetical protein
MDEATINGIEIAYRTAGAVQARRSCGSPLAADARVADPGQRELPASGAAGRDHPGRAGAGEQRAAYAGLARRGPEAQLNGAPNGRRPGHDLE